MCRISHWVLIGCLGFAIGGCGENSNSNSAPTQSEPPKSVGLDDQSPATLPTTEATESVEAAPNVPSGEKTSDVVTGSFRGVVTFKGDLPEPQVIQATKDREVCSAGEGEVYDVVVNDGKLLGAVIELTVKGHDVPEFKPPREGFVIRQKDCLFSPRLLVAYDGAELTVHNDDKVAHNVNSGQWNLLQGPGAKPITQKMNYGGTPFTRVTCNIHSWMETWVYVARSPFCMASDEKGEFLIEGVPVGTKIRGTIIHATLGKQRFTVDIEAGKPSKKNFEFAAK